MVGVRLQQQHECLLRLREEPLPRITHHQHFIARNGGNPELVRRVDQAVKLVVEARRPELCQRNFRMQGADLGVPELRDSAQQRVLVHVLALEQQRF